MTTTTSTTTHPLAVVTGASSGIGRSLAKELAQRGYDLIVAAENDDIVTEAHALSGGNEATPIQADLATRDGVERLVAGIVERDVPVDALVINAGVGVSGPFVETSLEDHLRLVELNVAGAVHLAHRVLPSMVRRGEGRVLFTSSIAATMPGPFASTYNASKSFLLSFAEALRVELADSGVTVTALMPGATDTNFFERAHMEDTKLGQTKKDDPDEVARDGIEAMLAGKDHVVAGSLRNKVQAGVSKALPDAVAAKASGKVSAPGSGE
jgi:short-subunit dehydrogenase